MKFRKKPVVIEARCFNLSAATEMKEIEDWCGGSVKGTALPAEERVIHIQTLEGEMEGKVGDWIIRGVKGEFYPCKPDIFAMTYEPEGATPAGSREPAEGRAKFEAWARPILGDNPNWKESGNGELAWQAWLAGSRAAETAGPNSVHQAEASAKAPGAADGSSGTGSAG